MISETLKYKDTPDLSIVDTKKAIDITLTGCSIPEDADEVYFPYIRKIQSTLDNSIEDKKKVTFNFKLSYYNTGSYFYITRILKILENHTLENKQVYVNWFYMDIDEDMQEQGLDYQQTLALNFKMIVYSENELF